MPPPADAHTPTRHMPRWLALLAAVALAARLVVAFIEKPPAEGASDSGPRVEFKGPDLVRWVPPDSAAGLAADRHRPILYDFAADWCGPCKQMKGELFGNPEAAAFINATFIPARVIDRAVEDGHNPEIVDALQKRYNVRAFPTLVVARETGEPTILQGYAGKAETLKQLKAAAVAGR